VSDKTIGTLLALLTFSIALNAILFFEIHRRNKTIGGLSPKVTYCSVDKSGGGDVVVLVSEPSQFFSLGVPVNLFFLEGRMELRIGEAIVENVQSDGLLQFKVRMIESGQQAKWDGIHSNIPESLKRIRVRLAVSQNG
jgi:hypothetical protein